MLPQGTLILSTTMKVSEMEAFCYTWVMKHAEGRIAAGGIVIDGGKVLTVINRSDNSITFPKGTVEEGESIEAAAIREVREETGFDVTVIDNLGETTFEFTWTDGKQYKKKMHFFLMKLSGAEVAAQRLEPDENFDVEWLRIDHAHKELTFNDSKDLLEIALKSSKLVY